MSLPTNPLPTNTLEEYEAYRRQVESDLGVSEADLPSLHQTIPVPPQLPPYPNFGQAMAHLRICYELAMREEVIPNAIKLRQALAGAIRLLGGEVPK